MAENGELRKILIQEKDNSRNQTIEQTIKDTVNFCKKVSIGSLITFFLLLYALMLMINLSGIGLVGGLIWMYGYPIFSLMITYWTIKFVIIVVDKPRFKNKIQSYSFGLVTILTVIAGLILIFASCAIMSIIFMIRVQVNLMEVFFMFNIILTFFCLLTFIFVFFLMRVIISRSDGLKLIGIGIFLSLICIISLFYFKSYVLQIALVCIFSIGVSFLITIILINKYDKIQIIPSNKIYDGLSD